MNEVFLKYSDGAKKWEEALPLGNGRIGVMVFSRGKNEILRLNEETLWEGFPHDFDNPETREYLPKLRQLIFEKKYLKAFKLAEEKHICMDGGASRFNPGEPFGSFRGAGDLLLEDHDEVKVLKRTLELENGILKTETDRYTRTHFVSLNENVFVTEITGENLNISVRFDPDGGDNRKILKRESRERHFCGEDIIKDFSKSFEGVTVDGNVLRFSEQLQGKGAMKWAMECRIITDGTKLSLSDGIKISNATNIKILLSLATSYNHNDPEKVVTENIEDAIKNEDFLTDHINEFSSIFNRSNLSLESDEILKELDTDKRLLRVQNGEEDIGFSELFFNYGKYLLISSSYKKSALPANLQGLWTKDNAPPWSGDYHININLQMNYWPSEILNLSECNNPLFEYIRFLSVSGKKTAEIMYGCSGWVTHHATTPHGFTSACQNPRWGIFTCAGAWCITHIFEHYRYTLDIEFLKKYWDVVKGSVSFFLDFLVTDPDGYLVICPSSSPENAFIEPESGEAVTLDRGSTMDTQIVRDLFEGYLEFSDIVGDYEFNKKVEDALLKFMPTKVGKLGTVMEWREDFEEAEPGHRHMSHLYGLFPSEQINKNTPELFEAAKKTIERRLKYGGGHTGWSRAGIINFYARLLDGQEAYNHLMEFYKKSTVTNLFDSHPPFQIDGNFGVTAGIANMLLSDVAGEITLLPALPESWKNGSFSGFCAKGNKIVSCSWRDGVIINSEIKNKGE